MSTTRWLRELEYVRRKRKKRKKMIWKYLFGLNLWGRKKRANPNNTMTFRGFLTQMNCVSSVTSVIRRCCHAHILNMTLFFSGTDRMILTTSQSWYDSKYHSSKKQKKKQKQKVISVKWQRQMTGYSIQSCPVLSYPILSYSTNPSIECSWSNCYNKALNCGICS